MWTVFDLPRLSMAFHGQQATARWWNWDSFGPDLIVGVATGSLIAVAVFLAESRRGERAQRRETRAAQAKVVSIARSALRSRVQFISNGMGLYPERSGLERLAQAIDVVPVRDQRQHAAGYALAVATVNAADQLEDLARAIDESSTRFRGLRSERHVQEIIITTVKKLIVGEVPIHAWSWHSLDGQLPSDDPVSADSDLRQKVQSYVMWRWRLEGFRQAFDTIETKYRAAVQFAAVQAAKGAPHDPITSWLRTRGMKREVAKALDSAIEESMTEISRQTFSPAPPSEANSHAQSRAAGHEADGGTAARANPARSMSSTLTYVAATLAAASVTWSLATGSIWPGVLAASAGVMALASLIKP